MSGILGALGLADTDRSFVGTIGQSVVYDAVRAELARHNEELRAAYNLFVGERTSDFKRRYKLPGGGFMQRRGLKSEAAAVKAYGSWDIALPLEDFGDQFAADDVSLAYMTMQELNTHLDTIQIQNVNTVRFEMLRALLNNTVFTFIDPIHGSLSVQPLANGDAVVYPPVIGSYTEAADSHYLVSQYAAASISDSNNPFVTIAAELSEHFGQKTGGNNIVVFINSAQETKTEDLTDFDSVTDRFTIPGANVDQLTGLPDYVPGRIIGRSNGCWISVWDYIPANYMLAIYDEPVTPKPLIERIDSADTGLPIGLTLIAKDVQYPLETSHYRNRVGYGVGNRLNGVVMFLDAGASYTIPTGFTR